MPRSPLLQVRFTEEQDQSLEEIIEILKEIDPENASKAGAIKFALFRLTLYLRRKGYQLEEFPESSLGRPPKHKRRK